MSENASLIPNQNSCTNPYIIAASIAIVVYDFAVNFILEVQLIWSSPWTYTKVLYLLIRYPPLAFIYFIIYVWFLQNTTIEHCKVAFSALTWGYSLCAVCSEAVLFIRTWAVWRKSRILGFLLVPCYIVGVVLQFVSISKWEKGSTMEPTPYPEFSGCLVVFNPSVMRVPYIVLVVVDAVLLLLMVISAYRTYAEWRSGSKLSTVIHRDGILYYICFLGTSITNVVLLYTLNSCRGLMLYMPSAALYSVLTCRVVLNIRKAAKKTVQFTSLHEFSPEDNAIPMRFTPGEPQRHVVRIVDPPRSYEGDNITCEATS